MTITKVCDPGHNFTFFLAGTYAFTKLRSRGEDEKAARPEGGAWREICALRAAFCSGSGAGIHCFPQVSR
jgi:hypothetical protein